MKPTIIVVSLIAGLAPAQTITSAVAPVIGFVDISTTGGTQIQGVGDDSLHAIVTTVGNALFPAGDVVISTNGVALCQPSGGLSPLFVDPTNQVIPPAGLPIGLPICNGAICPFWDDLTTSAAAPLPEIWWQEAGGVLFLMWKSMRHFPASPTNTEAVTFEVQVFGNPAPGAPLIQMLYPDTVFGPVFTTSTFGGRATIGYVSGANLAGSSAPWSFDTQSVPSGTVLSVVPPLNPRPATAGPFPRFEYLRPPALGYVDLAVNGGTQITGLSNDSEHGIVTTVGNVLFPAGNVRIGANGVAVSGVTAGDVAPANAAIPATGTPAGLPIGTGTVCAFWDDLNNPVISPPAQIWWRESGGVLIIEWRNFYSGAGQAGELISFEVQVFGGGQGPLIQILYPDPVFGTGAASLGGTATIGYVSGTNPGATNAQWSFDTPSVSDDAVLSLVGSASLSMGSPLGLGSLAVTITSDASNGTYLLPVTFVRGTFPNGWLFGVDITYGQLVSELTMGYPFTGPLGSFGATTLGPFGGLPTGFSVYAVAAVTFPGGVGPQLVSPPVAYTVP